MLKGLTGTQRLVLIYGGTASLLAVLAVQGCKTGDLTTASGDPPPGTIAFNDPSPPAPDNTPSDATYVGSAVCASCHSRVSNGHPNGLYAEWQKQPHANDPTKLAGNLLTRTIADTHWPGTTCAGCHVTGAPDAGAPVGSVRNGYDTSQTWSTSHNAMFYGIQCEACHGAGSAHVASGGSRLKINRVPISQNTCWHCHVHYPNEKGNIPTGPADDTLIAFYSGSLGHSHNAGGLISNTGGYEYPGHTYTHSPHGKIRNTCATCHGLPLPGQPFWDHKGVQIGTDGSGNPTYGILPRKETCAHCHGGAASASDLGHVIVNPQGQTVEDIQTEINGLLIQLGGASNGAPDANAAGGALGTYLTAHSGVKDAKYNRARWNFMWVNNDSSAGVHDYEYAKELVTDSLADLGP